MQRVGVWIPSELLVAGEEVQLYGPDSDGVVDLVAGAAGGRALPVPTRDGEHHAPGRSYDGPWHLGTFGHETRMLLVFSRELPTGLHEFAARAFDRETGEPAADPTETFEVFINTAPRAARAVRAVEELVSGRLRFNYGQLEE